MTEDEIDDQDHLELALVDFRTMSPKMQKQFLLSILDEYMSLAKDGKLEKYIAGQVLTRAQIVAGFYGLQLEPPLGTLRRVRHG